MHWQYVGLFHSCILVGIEFLSVALESSRVNPHHVSVRRRTPYCFYVTPCYY